MKFIAQIDSTGDVKLEDLQAFYRDTSEAAFLFKGKQIPAFLKGLYDRSVDLLIAKSLNKSKTVQKSSEDQEWFTEKSDECRKLFAKDLSLVAACAVGESIQEPQREALFSGRFLNERRAVCSAWSAAGRLGRRSLSTKCGSFHRNERGRCSGLYTEPG